jgi:Arc/MetJ-type ribon-helix-helix transcriptional regulator
MAQETVETTQLTAIKLAVDMLNQIDDFRFTHRFNTRSDAIRFLLQKGLESGATPKPEERATLRRSA